MKSCEATILGTSTKRSRPAPRLTARRLAGLIAASAVLGAVLLAGRVGGPLASAALSTTRTIGSGCKLGNGIQHVIDIVFDNVHFNRDNPNVLSDLEQMPAL